MSVLLILFLFIFSSCIASNNYIKIEDFLAFAEEHNIGAAKAFAWLNARRKAREPFRNTVSENDHLRPIEPVNFDADRLQKAIAITRPSKHDYHPVRSSKRNIEQQEKSKKSKELTSAEKQRIDAVQCKTELGSFKSAKKNEPHFIVPSVTTAPISNRSQSKQNGGGMDVVLSRLEKIVDKLENRSSLETKVELNQASDKRGIFTLKWPKQLENKSWDDIKKICHHTFYNELRVVPEPAGLIDSVPIKQRQFMFETFADFDSDNRMIKDPISKKRREIERLASLSRTINRWKLKQYKPCSSKPFSKKSKQNRMVYQLKQPKG